MKSITSKHFRKICLNIKLHKKKKKILKFPYLANKTRYGPEIFSKLVSPMKVTAQEVSVKKSPKKFLGTTGLSDFLFYNF